MTVLSDHNFRNYDKADDLVRQTYALNHKFQTFDYVISQKQKYSTPKYGLMGVWEALELLDKFVDESDPDTSLSQLAHAIQSAEAARRDGQPDWMILTTLIHDLGKILHLMNEPQWAIVGDTFPVGCRFSQNIVYYEEFVNNPDFDNEKYNTKYGIYKENCGLDSIHMSWGHDEYLYNVVKDYLPKEASYVIRYHSFYAAHNKDDYRYLFNSYDHDMIKHVKSFNKYDLYSKKDDILSVENVRPYYEALISRFFPDKIQF